MGIETHNIVKLMRKRTGVNSLFVRLPTCGLVGFWLAASACVGSAAVVYDNTTGPGNLTFAGEVGDTVTLAGTERYVTSISIGVVGNGYQPVSDDSFQMRLWSADGPGGTAGTLLWQSASLNIPLAGPLQMISFDVPSVLVPNTLIWDVSHTDSGNVGFEWSNPIAVGSSPDYAWAYLTQQLQPYYGTPANFMARIDATAVVPEPSALVLFGLGAMLYGTRIRFNKGRQG
jgi:hypothetical protein